MRRMTLVLALLIVACSVAQGEPAELHGSVAVSWYRFDDADEDGYDYDRPAARLSFKASNLMGGHYDLKVRARTRYNDRADPVGGRAETEWRNRIYEASLTYDNPDSPFGFTAGRIMARDMGGVGYTDGALITYRLGDDWRVGALAGTRPDWETSEFQTDLIKYGAFVGFERGDRAGTRVEVRVAAIGEYHESDVSREFLYVRTSYHRERRLDLYGTAELDLNRDWREDRAGESMTLTALYLRGRYRVNEDVTLGLGYDTRSNYRTYETRSVPDSLFIDAARSGGRASVQTKLPAGFRLNADFGMRDVEDDGSDPTYFYSAEISSRGLLDTRIRGSLRVAGFDSPYALGTNATLRFSRSFRGGHSAHVSYGTYSYGFDQGDTDRFNQWVSVGGQVALPARFYVSSEYRQDWGDDSEGSRVLGEAGYRF